MLTDREEKIVRWLRQQDSPADPWELAAAIERLDHLKRPEPTIPFDQWKDKPSVGP